MNDLKLNLITKKGRQLIINNINVYNKKNQSISILEKNHKCNLFAYIVDQLKRFIIKIKILNKIIWNTNNTKNTRLTHE